VGYQEVFKDKKKKKRFIKLICQIEGVEYKETKEVKERQIRITDVALVAKEVLGIDLKIDI
jgi:phage-related protein